jgi:hypothetical protein
LKQKPFALFFASKEDVSVLGETAETIKMFAASHNNSMPSLVFDLPKVINHLRGMGVVEFVKLANDKANRDLANKYDAGNAFIVVLDPKGEKIGGWSLVGNGLVKTVDAIGVAMDAWMKAHPPAK